MSLFPACATGPCNQHRVHQYLETFPRSRGENAVTKIAQYGRTEHGEECGKSGVATIRYDNEIECRFPC